MTRFPSLCRVPLALDVALWVDNIAVECKQALVLALVLALCTDNLKPRPVAVPVILPDLVLPWSPEAFACPLYFGSSARTVAQAAESSAVAAGK